MRLGIGRGAAGGLLVAAALCAPAGAQAREGTVRDLGAHVMHLVRDVHGHAANLPYGGGPVLHWNRTHVIFWEPSGSGLSFDPGYESLIETFLANVAAASRSPGSVYGLTGQYRDARGPAAYVSTYGGAVIANDPLPANGCTEPPATGPGWHDCLTDAQLQREIQSVTRSDQLPTGPNDVYFLVTPNGLGNCSDAASTSCALGGDANGYCAYHSQTSDGILYAVIPYNAVPGHCESGNPRPNNSTADPALSTISHEHSEMVTDPFGTAWIQPQSGNEDGDLCLTSFGPDIEGSAGASGWNEDINGGHYYLQEEWSNADGACEPRATPDSVAFATSPSPLAPGATVFAAHAHAAHGRIVSLEWFFGDHRAGRGRRIVHRYGRPGIFRVVLRTTDSWGNWSFYARTVAASP